MSDPISLKAMSSAHLADENQRLRKRVEELEAVLREVRSQAGHLEYTWRMTFLDLIDTALAAKDKP